MVYTNCIRRFVHHFSRGLCVGSVVHVTTFSSKKKTKRSDFFAYFLSCNIKTDCMAVTQICVEIRPMKKTENATIQANFSDGKQQFSIAHERCKSLCVCVCSNVSDSFIPWYCGGLFSVFLLCMSACVCVCLCLFCIVTSFTTLCTTHNRYRETIRQQQIDFSLCISDSQYHRYRIKLNDFDIIAMTQATKSSISSLSICPLCLRVSHLKISPNHPTNKEPTRTNCVRKIQSTERNHSVCLAQE